MKPQIDYFYAIASGFAYLGEPRLVKLAASAGAQIHYKPVDIRRVFAASGTIAPAEQSPAKLAWRRLDMQRWAARLKMPLEPVPSHWPVSLELPSRAVIAASRTEPGAGPLSFALLTAVWAGNKNIANRETIISEARSSGYDPDQILAGLADVSTGKIFNVYTEEAIAQGVIGSPTYIYGGEMYFGQDRLSFLAEALGIIFEP